jgi:hypothetical protein
MTTANVRLSNEGQLNDLFAGVLGQIVWQANTGFGNSITLEFGQPQLRIREPLNPATTEPNSVLGRLRRRSVVLSGMYHLWVQNCTWEITDPTQLIQNPTNSEEKIFSEIELLNGQYLKAVISDLRQQRLTFEFDLGSKLLLSFPESRADSDILELFGPTNTFALSMSENSFFAEMRDARE